MSIIHDMSAFENIAQIRSQKLYKHKKFYGALFAQVTTVNVLTAEPTTPARIDPSMAWFTTISGKTLPSHATAFGTIR
jgi:hypothetical protein